MDSMPARPLRLYELREIEEDEDIKNVEPLYYQGNNVNAVVCFLVNSSDTAYILGYDPDEEEWSEVSVIDSSGDVQEYSSESKGVIEWIEERFGEGGYSVYGHDDVIE